MWLISPIEILPGLFYPTYRITIILTALVVALLLYILVMRTRLGMLIRAGASNREMTGALGVNINLLYTLVFGLGAALAGLAGLMQAPILTVQIGMGENILILAFVVIIIGGIGSIRGAFIAAVLVGLIDTIGRAFLPDLLRLVLSSRGASTVAPAHVVDDDLPADGDRPGIAAGGSVSGIEQMMSLLTLRNAVVAFLLFVLAALPLYALATGNVFLVTLFTRIIILAMAATSLNLILGYGGMVSFGHAAYLGIGGYAVGILAAEGVASGFLQWPVALLASRAVRPDRGCALAAHARRLFHHDHARIRAAAVLFRRRSRPLRRRRRVEHPPAQPIRRPHRSLQPDAILLSLFRAAARNYLRHLAAGELAFRHGNPGGAL